VGPRARRRAILGFPTALIGGGIVLVLLGIPIGGLGLILVALVSRAAIRSRWRRQELARIFDGVTVGDVMETVPFVVVAQATLDTFAPALEDADEATVARVMRGDELLGLVGPREIRRVPRRRWAEVHAADAMTALSGLPVLGPRDPLGPAVERLVASTAPGLPVESDGRLAGLLTRLAVGRTVHEGTEAVALHDGRR
jgi:hypothetical protein